MSPSRFKIDPLILRFIGLFFLFVLVLTAAVKASWTDTHIVGPYTEFLAALSAGIMNLFGGDVQAHGSALASGAASVEVRRGCDGLEATILLVSACLAYPAPWKMRLIGTVAGFAFIFVMNLVRIIGLAWISFGGSGENFEFFHVYVSQFAVIALTMVFWVYWAGKQKPVRG